MTEHAEGVPTEAAVLPVHYISFSADINPTTTETLLGVCGELVNKGAATIYCLISTPGGQVMYGMNIYNALRALPVRIIMHNVGNVDSIGNIVFLAGEERYSCPNATFMFHGVGFDQTDPIRLEEKLLQEKLDNISADHLRMARILSERTKLSTDDAHQLFQRAQTRDPHFALDKGIVHGIKDATVPKGAPFLQFVFKR